MNDKNLVPISSRNKTNGEKGGKNSVTARHKDKKEAQQNQKLVDILKKVIFFEVKPEVKSEVVKKKIKELGLRGAIILLLFVQFQQQNLCKKDTLM